MKEISIQELHNDTDQWVRLAAVRERIIIIDGGQPIAALTPIEPTPKRLPDREAKINRRSRIETDSAAVPAGKQGNELLRFAGAIEAEDLKIISQAVEEDCGATGS